MKQHLRLIFIAILTANAVGTHAAVLSGSILHDITLPPGYHQIDGIASVAPGVILKIEPGAVIHATAESRLVVGGTLQAIGTDNNPIIFTGDIQSRWGGIELSNSVNSTIRGTIIEHAWDAVSLNGLSDVSIIGNIFRHNGVAITDSYGYQPMTVEHNTFQDNISAFEGIRTVGESSISYNNFIGNQNVLKFGYYFGTTTVENNNFIGNSFVARAPEIGYGYGDLRLGYNYWGNASKSEIAALIYDANDFALLQLLVVDPLVDTQIATAGSQILVAVPDISTWLSFSMGLFAILSGRRLLHRQRERF